MIQIIHEYTFINLSFNTISTKISLWYFLLQLSVLRQKSHNFLAVGKKNIKNWIKKILKIFNIVELL
jgi:hypothetical protein